MALHGECVGKNTVRCCCSTLLTLKVLRSAAGYYIGFSCPECGPYSRESGYYRTKGEADSALTDDYFRR